jgi:hypothetical protein
MFEGSKAGADDVVNRFLAAFLLVGSDLAMRAAHAADIRVLFAPVV